MPEQRRFVLWRGPGAAGIAGHMNDEAATANVLRERIEQRVAALLEVFLHLDLERTAFERAELIGKLQTIGAKLAADGGDKNARG